ncbi:MAG: flagellar basal body L-ring protein FlgH [Nitrospinae bacterium]|nr:flagellar basal body L-ring protein FlgH [Nitrospinota bacterium]
MATAACSSIPQFKSRPDPKDTVIPDKLYSASHKEEGAIWPGETSENMLFQDTRGKQLGDIVTILVSESSTSTQTATTSTSKDSSIDMQAGTMLGLPSNFGVGNFLGSGNALNPSVNAKTSRSNSGSGTTTRQGRLTATISAVITEILPSGNLRVEGKRVVTINNEDQVLVLKGMIRPMDINFDNTVSSTLIADAEITYVGKGVISDEQTVGWATRALSWIWPF